MHLARISKVALYNYWLTCDGGYLLTVAKTFKIGGGLHVRWIVVLTSNASFAETNFYCSNQKSAARSSTVSLASPVDINF